MDNLLSWPPAFILTKSVRAKHVRLKMSAKHGLELVVPQRFNAKHVPAILETNKAWILKQLLAMELKSADTEALPNEIQLPAVNQTWKIAYVKMDSAKLRLFKRPHQQLALLGCTENEELVKRILTTWLKNQAKVLLSKRLGELSALIKLPYSQLSIRAQRSRWGSCSSDKAINLNYKLLFLPPQLADHIMIHELCHTKHMNHSAKFWRLVASFDLMWKEHNKAIKTADKYVPSWCDL